MLDVLPRSHEGNPVAPEQIPVDAELTLVMTHEADAAEGYRLVDANRKHLSKHLSFAESYTLEKAQQSYRAAEEKIRAGKLGNYFIVHRGENVGTVGMSFGDNGRGTLGYWLVESAQHQGIATRSVLALLSYAFSERHLKIVELDIKSANTESQDLAIRIGAHNTGRRKIEDGQEFDIWEISRDGEN
jgi:RimJ/RimL family protein N-acetyltransferase